MYIWIALSLSPYLSIYLCTFILWYRRERYTSIALGCVHTLLNICTSCQPGLEPALHYAIRAGPALSLSLSLFCIYIHIYHDICERDIRRLRLDVCIHSSTYAHPVTEQSGFGACMQIRSSESGDPESSQGQSDCCKYLQSDALPTELSPGWHVHHGEHAPCRRMMSQHGDSQHQPSVSPNHTCAPQHAMRPHGDIVLIV